MMRTAESISADFEYSEGLEDERMRFQYRCGSVIAARLLEDTNSMIDRYSELVRYSLIRTVITMA